MVGISGWLVAPQHRIDRIGENIVQFEANAAGLAGDIDLSLTSLKPRQIAASLQERLIEAGKAETRRSELEDQNTKDEAAVASCRTKAHAANGILQRLRELASCQDDLQLEAAIAAAEEKSKRQEDYKRIAAGLVERNAIPDLKQIEEEASAYEVDSVRNEVGRHEERQKELQDQVFKAGTEYGRLQQEYERLEGSEDAALQAQTAEDALAKVRPAIAQYLRLRIAAEVLERAMDSYREKHQGPLLTRASELFSRLTLGEHDGLTTAFGDDDKPVLVAIRKSKEHVEVAGLSDGTRDQLYLALRLAAIEDHVARVAPCPMILDSLTGTWCSKGTPRLSVLGEHISLAASFAEKQEYCRQGRYRAAIVLQSRLLLTSNLEITYIVHSECQQLTPN